MPKSISAAFSKDSSNHRANRAQLLRREDEKGEEELDSPDAKGYLLKRNPNGIHWWKMRWFQLHGSSLRYWDSEQQHAAGEIHLDRYRILYPPKAAHPGTAASPSLSKDIGRRAFEICLMPRPDGAGSAALQPTQSAQDGQPLQPRFLAADNAETFEYWKKALESVTEVFDPQQGGDGWVDVSVSEQDGLSMTILPDDDDGAVLVESIVTPKAPADSADGGGDPNAVSLEHFDQLSVLGKGGFGKVLLVRHAGGRLATGKQYAMKILLKSFIIEKQEVEHTKVERDILKCAEAPQPHIPCAIQRSIVQHRSVVQTAKIFRRRWLCVCAGRWTTLSS